MIHRLFVQLHIVAHTYVFLKKRHSLCYQRRTLTLQRQLKVSLTREMQRNHHEGQGTEKLQHVMHHSHLCAAIMCPEMGNNQE
ncbi:hypothetical protein GDO81_002829 [Engystomops pustulosus]|uniref:Uncharacterized protein n=1 Tax=Engystomops pustulosus TaxID=76066 RepID=A0AAV7DN63_ENGPU|nr:hypothetical protein GDO81_002829 [Engystomops pustulosus]